MTKRSPNVPQQLTRTETSAQAFKRLQAEAHRRLYLIEQAIKTAPKDADWGDVGSMYEVVKNLGDAGHWAGVAELTEK